MKQLDIFATDNDTTGPVQWKLFIDGAARNNPGPAGAGIYLLKDAQPFLKKGVSLGQKTNNQAEYLALLLGLFYVMSYKQQQDKLHVIADSELLVKQVRGEYKVRNPELQKLHTLAVSMVKKTDAIVMHVLRTDNHVADAMANQGINERVPVPDEFIALLTQFSITL